MNSSTRTTLAECLLLGTLAACKQQPEPADEPFDLDDARIVAVGAMTHGPNGVAVGPEGKVYAASVLGDEITVHDPASGRILDRIGPERGVHGPDDVVVASDGTIYWTETLAGNVGMLEPNGDFRTQRVGSGVNPIALSEDGRLLVARAFFGRGLYELDPQLVEPPRPILPELEGLNGMEFSPDGRLYAPLFFEGSVVCIDVDAPMPAPEVVATGFRVPSGVAFSPAGDLHVTELAEGRVTRVDLSTGERQTVLDIEGIFDNLAFAPDGTLYASALADGRVLAREPDGEVRALGKAGLAGPGGVAVAGGRVWIADFFSLRGYGRGTTPERSFYDRFDPPGEGIGSSSTVAARGDDLVISGWFPSTIQVLDPASGEVLEDVRTIGMPTNAIAHGSMLVATSLEERAVADARTGAVLLDGLEVPLGLASDGRTLYAGDWSTGTIWRLEPGEDAVPLARGLASPEGLALDGERLLVVEEANDRVVGIDLTTGAVTPVIEDLELGIRVFPGAVPYGIFNGIAVAPDGTIVVTSDVENTAYALR